MSLRKKLFLTLGVLIFLVLVPLYLFSTFYLVAVERAEEELLSPFAAFSKMLAARLFLHMIVLALFFLLMALAVLWRITREMTRPLEKLVSETEKIVSGQWEEIHFPDVAERKDEVAQLTRSIEMMVRGLKDREKIRSLLNKVVSKEVVEKLLETGLQLGGEDRVVTVLFSDIRNFTAITEHLSPQNTIGMLNAFMTKMTHVIEGEGGVIDKYVGDEIMALYGAPVSYPDHALRSLSTAIIMIETLRRWNAERRERGEQVLEVGIGIHTGLVVAGNMGAEDRLNYTVLGSSVNLAARLCQAAAPMQILISEYTLAEPNIADSFYVKALPPLTVKGFSTPVKVFEIAGFKWEGA